MNTVSKQKARELLSDLLRDLKDLSPLEDFRALRIWTRSALVRVDGIFGIGSVQSRHFRGQLGKVIDFLQSGDTSEERVKRFIEFLDELADLIQSFIVDDIEVLWPDESDPEETEQLTKEAIESPQREVFVVHGRNEPLRRDLFSFLRAIGLDPIDWGRAIALTGKATPIISEILDAAFQHAQAVVVLLTGDDEGKLRNDLQGEDEPDYEKVLSPQARPNVLFEAGMALASHPARTVLVQIGELRPFSDIAGRHIVRLDNSIETRQGLAQRLAIAGCPVDLTGTDWHRVGDFEVAKEAPASSELAEKQATTLPVARLRSQLLLSDQNLIERIRVQEGVTADEVAVLVAVANSGPNQIEENQIIQSVHMHHLRAEYAVQSLREANYLSIRPQSQSPLATGLVYYWLTDKGKELLVKCRLV